MRLAEVPNDLGERDSKTPKWEQDRANAALWYDAKFFESFSAEDFPELPDSVRASILVLVASFRRAAQDNSIDLSNARILANTHLWSIIERLRPALEHYWNHHAVSNVQMRMRKT